MRKEYTFHSKEGLVKRRLSGESERKLSAKTGISRASIYKWVKQYLEAGESALESKKKTKESFK